jgi:hypothetical protein
MSKWFYNYRVEGNGEDLAVSGPYDSQEECAMCREEHAAQKPEDECSQPEEHPDNYAHVFYSNR